MYAAIVGLKKLMGAKKSASGVMTQVASGTATRLIMGLKRLKK